MGVKITNNATSTLAGSISDSDLSLAIQGGDASKFPTIGVGEWFYVTLEDASLNREVMKVTARVGATLTVTRGQDGFAARAWNAGDKIECRLNLAALVDLTNVGDAVNGATAATTMADTDKIGFWQAAGTALRHITWANFYEAMRTKLGAMVSANTAKSTPVDADQLLMSDSASSNASVKLSWANLKAGVFAAWGALINGGTAKTTPVDADAVAIMDSAASNATKKTTFTQMWTNYFKGKADALYAVLSLLTTRGDMIYRDAAGWQRLPKGASGQVLTMGADDPGWATAASGVDTYDAVGSYCLASTGSAASVLGANNTLAGSNLVPTGLLFYGPDPTDFGGGVRSGSALSGTWRTHGYSPGGYANRHGTTLWIRTV